MEASFVPSIILVSLLVVMVALGVPIAFLLCFLGILGCLVWVGSGSIIEMAQTFFCTGSSDILVCLPLFLLLAEIIVASGIGTDLFNASNVWVGKLKGGVAAGTIVGGSLFGAISGSSTANIAAVGVVAIKEMLRLGYNKELACGTVMIVGALDILIPPSIIMVIYAVLTEQSIGELFVAGIIPGGIFMLVVILYILVRCRLNPGLAPHTLSGMGLKDKLYATRKVIPFVLIFLFMFWGFYSGAATPTETAGLGVLASLIIGVAMKRLNLRNIFEATRRASLNTAFVIFIVAGAKFFTFALSATRISFILSQFIVGLNLSPLQLIIMIMAIYFIMGCFIDSAGMLTITIPFLLPALHSANINLIWFGILATVNCETGYLTPPFGFNLFVLKALAPPEVSMNNIIKGGLPFVGITILFIILLIIFPEMALWLPSRM